MDCDHIREALSARLDGEHLGLDGAALDQHLDGCAACAAWGAEIAALHRGVRVREAEPVPDLSEAILRTVPLPAGRRRVPVSTARWALFTVALTQLVLAAPALLLGEDSGATMHVARELGSFDVALAVGLLVAVWQPERAWGLLPVAAALAVVMGGTAVIDLTRGSTSTLGEAHHLLDAAGVGLLWAVAKEATHLPRRSRTALTA
jgi:predicted anti-sigma-YlaC factor YlaD